MLIKELPSIMSDKTFTNVKEFLVFIYQKQIVTEFGELTENEVTSEMKKNYKEAKKIARVDFVNL